MRILLDTHVAVWAVSASKLLSSEERALIAEPTNAIFVSVASIWEIAIKRSLARAGAPFSSSDALGYFRASGYRLLDITIDHATRVETLPPLHTDPFDRLIIAQAITEPLCLVTHDKQVARYSDTILLF